MDILTKQVDVLLSYPIGKIFTSDTPSSKEKKLEARCVALVNKYYKIDSPLQIAMRATLHELEGSFLLMCNEVAIPHIMAEAGRLWALMEYYHKLIPTTIKSEAILQDYYKSLDKKDIFDEVIYQVEEKAKNYGVVIDPPQWKSWYYDAYKQHKKFIQENK